jgi:hypothetical protein
MAIAGLLLPVTRRRAYYLDNTELLGGDVK